jgi:hypothetical protein
MSNERTEIKASVYTEDLQRIAKRIYDIMDPWEREFTVEEIAEDIKESPLAAIKWLISRVEED